MIYHQMIKLLERGGVDVATFNKRSPKTLFDLFEEVLHRDVKLGIDEHLGIVIRYAVSAAILIRVPAARSVYFETERRYRTGFVSQQRKKHTISETVRANESIEAAAARGLIEEINLRVEKGMLQLMQPEPEQINLHESSVYKGIWSFTVMHRFLLDLSELPWDEQRREVYDNRTTIAIQRYEY